ncbi:hypothetical protein JL37_07395 [Achromobacter sp. RTa]|nr:hypothetical protein JL37_07395 [Achromobacter sp. RTa]
MKSFNTLPGGRCRNAWLALLACSFLGLAACTPGHAVARPSSPSTEDSTMKICLIVAGEVASATLYDNPTARDFASLLPLTLTMDDYATIERVSGLPRKLSTQGAPEGMAPAAGELTHYAPWGNLALFIEPRAYSRGLLPLGKVDGGLAILARSGPYRLRIERAQP